LQTCQPLTKVKRKKESTGHHLNRRCRPSDSPSSASPFDQTLCDVRTAACGSA
jgi:hypothetical protein